MFVRSELFQCSNSFAIKCLQQVDACSGYCTSRVCSKPWMKLAAY